MPFSRSHLYFLGVLVIAVVAFLPSYFLQLGSADAAHHFHAATATAWVCMLACQSWTATHGRIALHRAVGKGSYLLAPLFISSGFAIIHVMQIGGGPFRVMFAGGLGFADAIAVIAFGWLYFSALSNRRNVQLHSRYMAATVLLLISPIVARLLSFYVPGFLIATIGDLEKFPLNFHAGNGAALTAALVLIVRDWRSVGIRPPFLVAAIAIALQSIGFELTVNNDGWKAVMSAFADLPLLMVGILGWLAGLFLVIAARNQSGAAPGGQAA